MGNINFIIRTELKKIYRNKYTLLALIAIILIPLLYGFLYLWAFWDPYGNLEDMPVAIVNLDKGAIYDEEYLNAGNDIVERLQSEKNMSWHFTTAKEASIGLKEKRYYAVITIPEDFTAKVITIKDPEPTKAEIFYESDDSINFLGDRISLEAAKDMQKEVIINITARYSEKIIALKDELAENFTEGVDASEELSDGLVEATQGASSLKYGAQDAHEGAEDLEGSLKRLSEGAEQVSAGSQSIASNTQSLTSGIHSAYMLAQQKCSDPTLIATLSQIDSGASTLNTAQQSLAASNTQLAKSIDKIYSGSKSLTSGLEDLEDGTVKLKEGLARASYGSEELYAGLGDSQSYINDLDPVRVQKVVEMQHEPVVLYDITPTKSPDYGTALSPYFMQLSLFVGALLLLMLLKPKNLALTTSGCSRWEVGVSMFVVAAIFGAMQAMVLDVVIMIFLGLEVQSLIGLFLFTILVSWTFIAIIQLFIFMFGKVGQLLSIVLLMLQLTSAAGTFPIQTAPKFFQAISQFMPMTHGMSGIRDIIFYGWTSNAFIQAGILICFMTGFIILKIVFTQKRISYHDIHPRFEF